MKKWAVVAGLAMLAAVITGVACTGGSGDDATPGSGSNGSGGNGGNGSGGEKSMGVGTQDIWVYDSIRLLDGSGGTEDITEDIVDMAWTGVGDRFYLGGDLFLYESTSLQGRVVDENGQVMPSVSLQFGILQDALAGENFLVAISSADLDEEIVNLDADDQVDIDLTFLAGLNVGDTLQFDYLFGQALRSLDSRAILSGDIYSVEDGLTGLEIFEERWVDGRVQFLGVEVDGELQLAEILDQEAVIVEGSAIWRYAGKGFTVLGHTGLGALGGWRLGLAGGGPGAAIGTVIGGTAGLLLGVGRVLSNNNPLETPIPTTPAAATPEITAPPTQIPSTPTGTPDGGQGDDNGPDETTTPSPEPATPIPTTPIPVTPRSEDDLGGFSGTWAGQYVGTVDFSSGDFCATNGDISIRPDSSTGDLIEGTITITFGLKIDVPGQKCTAVPSSAYTSEFSGFYDEEVRLTLNGLGLIVSECAYIGDMTKVSKDSAQGNLDCFLGGVADRLNIDFEVSRP